MVKKYFFILFLVLISLALSGSFSYTYSAAPMGGYCQTPPVVTSAVQPNIMLSLDVSGSMTWCGYYANASQSTPCDNCKCRTSGLPCASNADCVSPDTCGSCGYVSSTTYEGYFNPSKGYDQDTNGVWQEYSGAGTCTAVCQTSTCKSGSSSCSNAGKYGSKAGACTLAGTSCTSSQYCCCTDTYQVGACGSGSGNFLNYIHMQRIDLLRWAMTGGAPSTCTGSNLYKPAFCDVELWKSSTVAGQVGASCTGSVSGTGCCGNSNLLNGDSVTQSGCVLKTADGEPVKVPWRRIRGYCSVSVLTNTDPTSCATAGGTWTPSGGLAYNFATLPLVPRMGFLAFDNNGTVDGIYMGDFTATATDTTDVASTSMSFPYMNLITHVNSIPPQNGTPTGPAMWDVYNYFAQKTPIYTDSSAKVASFGGLKPQSGSSTSWKNPMYICPGGSNCVYIPCAGNYLILMSDGQWNAPSCSISSCGTSTTNPPSSWGCCTTTTNADPVVPAYCMHSNFLNTVSNYQTKVSSVYTISLFGGGSGVLALENVAMYGSFNNNGGKLWPSNLTGFPGGSCTMTDCGSGKGSGCTALPASSADWDQNPVDGIPDTAYTASSASQIKSGILTAVQSILQQSTAGTAVSILASGEGSGANLLQAFFYPQKPFADAEIAWVGEMQNLWYYLDPKLQVSTIREDTVSDHKLELVQDNVVHFRFDLTQNKTVADLYADSTGTGSPLTLNATVGLEQTKNLWEAGNMLWSRNLSTSPRSLYTSTTGSSLINFSTANAVALEPYLQATGATAQKEATNLINYVSGIDVQYCKLTFNTCTINADCTGGAGDICTGYRPRTVALSTTPPITDHVWKLGDIISSTPKIQSWVPLNSYASDTPIGFNDQSYYQFTQSLNYKTRGAVYTGANDGMLHTFMLGLLAMINNPSDKFQIAQLCEDTNGNGICDSGETTTPDLGTELWAYIPRNSLPYLRYFADTGYCHLFYVDGTPYLFDASINAPSGCASSDYSLCARQTKCTGNKPCQGTNNALDLTDTSWRTVLIGGMGQGGACRQTAATCSVNVCSQHPGTTCTTNANCPNNASGETCLPGCVLSPITDPADGTKSVGYSSYFALDITNPQSPSLLWEFADPGLGFSTAGPAVVRVNGGAPASTSNNSTNGKWYAVLASGPTGPIDPSSYQFLGSSDQNLKLYILDLKTGTLLRTIDTGLKNAFAGSIVNSPVDTDRWNPGLKGNYQDNVIYIGYSQLSGGNWVGGVLRLTTGGSNGEDTTVNNWVLSTVITVPGAVTTSISHLQDRTNHRLWLYFGTGRYFYKISGIIDDANTQQNLYGIKEPCYSDGLVAPDTLDMSCTSTVSAAGLANATTSPPSSEPATGWFIALDPSGATDAQGNTYVAERVVTNPLAAFTGGVFFTTFEPTAAACGFSGQSFLWGVNYSTGGSPPSSALQGTALIQVSTGQVQEVSMATAFSDKIPGGSTQGRRTTAFQGVPPKGQGLSVVINPRAMKKILHMQEK